MKYIQLTQGKQALVDDEDYEYLNQWKWFYNNGYAWRKLRISSQKGDAGRIVLSMHRVINKTPDGFYTDHINGNKLDNRKSNLRNVTRSQNLANSKLRKDNSSGCKGVYVRKRYKSIYYEVEITINNKSIFVGYFTNKVKAIKARKEAEIKYFGEFARP
jgi:hypothetical protein